MRNHPGTCGARRAPRTLTQPSPAPHTQSTDADTDTDPNPPTHTHTHFHAEPWPTFTHVVAEFEGKGEMREGPLHSYIPTRLHIDIPTYLPNLPTHLTYLHTCTTYHT